MEGLDPEDRELNRQTDNLADLPQHFDGEQQPEFEDDGEELNLEDIDPQILEAAMQLGLDKNGIRQL